MRILTPSQKLRSHAMCMAVCLSRLLLFTNLATSSSVPCFLHLGSDQGDNKEVFTFTPSLKDHLDRRICRV